MTISKESLIDKLEGSAASLANFLSQKLTTDGFPERSFYGETLAAAFWSHFEGKFSKEQRLALSVYQKRLANSGVKIHKEFNLYGLMHILGRDKKTSSLLDIRSFPEPLYKKPTNWILLRALEKIKLGGKISRIFWANFAVLVVSLNRQDGLILDRRLGRVLRGDRSEEYKSYQYHAFMLVLLYELFEVTRAGFLSKSFRDGLDFLLGKMEPNGKVIYMGRGREQIFGHSAFICALALRYRDSKNDKYLEALGKAVTYLTKFQNKNGSFPLVLRVGDDRALWESYNNLYDYLPFAGLMLMRSAKAISGARR